MKCERLDEAQAAMFLACPFCGERPDVFQVLDERFAAPGWVVECRDMGCIFRRSRPNQSLDALLADWNRRAARPFTKETR